jgi:hypothetical protein
MSEMSTNRIHNLGAVARLAVVLVALAAAVTLTSVAAAVPDAAKQRASTQKVVVSPAIFAKLKARQVRLGKPVTASGTFTALQRTIGPSLNEYCAPPPQTCVIGTTLDKGTVTSTSTLVGKRPNADVRSTVRGTATATGKGGSVTWTFSAPTASIAPPRLELKHGPAAGLGGPVTIVVGTGEALITHATGDLAQLKGKKGRAAFLFNEVTGVLLVSALL